MQRDTLKRLLEAQQARRALVLITPLGGGSEEIVTEEMLENGHPQAGELAECFLTDRSRVVESDAGELFLQAFLPTPRMMIVGATHIAQVLVRLAGELDIEAFVIDPRTAFATEERFRDTEIVAEWPGEALARLGIDRRSAVICLAHVPNIDEEALAAALKSGCFYIGALGSRRSHAKRLERLKAQGFGDKELAVIHGPIGLNIGSATPGEIALSIIAEVVQALRTGDSGG